MLRQTISIKPNKINKIFLVYFSLYMGIMRNLKRIQFYITSVGSILTIGSLFKFRKNESM